VSGAIRLEMPSSPRYVSLARLVVSTIARGLEFSEESIDDLKVVVSEMCTNAIIHCENRKGEERIQMSCMPRPGALTVEVRDSGQGFDPSCVGSFEDGLAAGKGFGIPLIKCLVDEFELQTDREKGTLVRITKYDHRPAGVG
jgi:serine/threonine-protein kinase RsbW